MEKNNKIIAEFLEWDFDELSETFETPFLKLVEPHAFGDEQFSCKLKDFELDFNKDWNWLMAVVEKITSILMLDDNFKYNYLYIGYDFEDKEHYVNLYVSEDNQINGTSKTSKIEAVYEAVVKFINFYNKRKEEEVN